MIQIVSDRSLDYWRKFFRSADKDIFIIIMNAIRVAKADRRRELINNRQVIIDALYPQDPPELLSPEGKMHNNERKGCDPASEESKNNNNNNDNNNHNNEEREIEVMRIKELLINWQEKPEKALFESLRRLQVLRVSQEILRDTDIGRALSGLQNHTSNQIRNLAQILIQDRRLFSTTLPDALLDAQVSRIELSKFFDGMDDDGTTKNNELVLRDNRRRAQLDNTNLTRKEDRHMRAQEVDIMPHSIMEVEVKLPKFQERSCQVSNGNVQKKKETSDNKPSKILPDSIQDAQKKYKNSSVTSIKTKIYEDGEIREEVSNRNATRRKEHVEVPSNPLNSIQDACKQTKEPTSQDKPERNQKISIHKESHSLQKSREASEMPFSQTLKRKPTEVPSKASQSAHTELAYEDKMKTENRNIQENYKEFEKAKKHKADQALELQELQMKGQKEKQYAVKYRKNTDKRINMWHKYS